MVAPCMNLQRQTASLARSAVPSSIRAQLGTLPSREESPAEFRYVLARGFRSPVEASCPHQRPVFELGKTRPRFRRGSLCPAPPVGTPTSPPLPCSTLARLSSAPTRGTLPVVRHLKHEVDQDPRTGHHTGRRRPSQISDGRPPIGPVASGCYPAGPTPYGPGSRPGIVSTQG